MFVDGDYRSYLVVQPTDSVYSGNAMASLTKTFGSTTAVVLAFTGPGNISALRNTGNLV